MCDKTNKSVRCAKCEQCGRLSTVIPVELDEAEMGDVSRAVWDAGTLIAAAIIIHGPGAWLFGKAWQLGRVAAVWTVG